MTHRQIYSQDQRTHVLPTLNIQQRDHQPAQRGNKAHWIHLKKAAGDPQAKRFFAFLGKNVGGLADASDVEQVKALIQQAKGDGQSFPVSGRIKVVDVKHDPVDPAKINLMVAVCGQHKIFFGPVELLAALCRPES